MPSDKSLSYIIDRNRVMANEFVTLANQLYTSSEYTLSTTLSGIYHVQFEEVRVPPEDLHYFWALCNQMVPKGNPEHFLRYMKENHSRYSFTGLYNTLRSTLIVHPTASFQFVQTSFECVHDTNWSFRQALLAKLPDHNISNTHFTSLIGHSKCILINSNIFLQAAPPESNGEYGEIFYVVNSENDPAYANLIAKKIGNAIDHIDEAAMLGILFLLKHPNIVDPGSIDGIPAILGIDIDENLYVFMKNVTNAQSLDSFVNYVREYDLKVEDDILNIIVTLFDTILFMDAYNLEHNDMHSKNILINELYEPTIIDFGYVEPEYHKQILPLYLEHATSLAELLDNENSLKRDLIGTLAYLRTRTDVGMTLQAVMNLWITMMPLFIEKENKRYTIGSQVVIEYEGVARC